MIKVTKDKIAVPNSWVISLPVGQTVSLLCYMPVMVYYTVRLIHMRKYLSFEPVLQRVDISCFEYRKCCPVLLYTVSNSSVKNKYTSWTAGIAFCFPLPRAADFLALVVWDLWNHIIPIIIFPHAFLSASVQFWF